MALQAYGKRVIIETAKAEAKKGSIFIPDEAKKKPLKGKILSFGAEVTDLKVGTVVYYAAFSGTEIESGDSKVLVLNQEDVLATEQQMNTAQKIMAVFVGILLVAGAAAGRKLWQIDGYLAFLLGAAGVSLVGAGCGVEL